MINKYNRFFLKLPAILAFLFLVCSYVPVHRYYFSLSEIRVDTKKASLQLSCKLFTDDLETVLTDLYNKKVTLSDPDKNIENRKAVSKYINEHFKITISGKQLNLIFVGYESEGDATWCYFEVSKFTQKGKISIMNDLLYDHFPDQTNIIQFYWNDQNKSQQLTYPEKEAVFGF